jgi:signal transduction histidine kinase
MFGKLSKAKEKEQEREKLLQHVNSLEEGICFFSSDKKVEFHNSLFLQHIDTITDKTTNPLAVFYDSAFEKMNTFFNNRGDNNYFETSIRTAGKTFSLRLNIFEDNSFEIILNDITKSEKTRMLKQELTGNIAHELRTPVTSIRGYLETLLEQPLDDAQRQHFLHRAYESTITLSELISDMGLLTKIDQSSSSFKLENVNIIQLLDDLKADIAVALEQKSITMSWNMENDVVIYGNRNLLYCIFRNLSDNTIKYAGDNISISVSKYNEDNDFYYFSFYDTGIGIYPESHLNRIFERFYRISEGRTRESGGSGLGLSIVKNAVGFHGGFIVAKNRTKGGLEFLFSIKKKVI